MGSFGNFCAGSCCREKKPDGWFGDFVAEDGGLDGSGGRGKNTDPLFHQ